MDNHSPDFKHTNMPLKKLTFLLILTITTFQFVSAQKTAIKEGRRNIAIEDIWKNYRFFPSSPSEFNWMNDDSFYSVMEKGKIEKYSVKDRKRVATLLDISELKDPENGETLQITSYSFSDDETKVLLTSDRKSIYRRSSKERCFVWDTETEKLYKLQGGDQISFATFSPDGKQIAFMDKNNLFTFNFSTRKTQSITTDGKWNEIINGGTDWVYEEEFAFTRAFFWSPDSKTIAYYRFDESHVKEFSMTMYGNLYPEEYKFKYPKAGEKNAYIDLYFYHLGNGKKVKADIGTEKDQYIPRIKWTKAPNKLAVMRMNRLQNRVEVLLIDAESGSSNVILTEKEDTYVEQPSDNTWIFLENGTEFLWQSEADGHNHIYLYNFTGKLVRQITKGDFDVTAISAVDNVAKQIYFMSTAVSPLERHLYQVAFSGKKPKRLSKEPGWHTVNFSSGNSFYMDSYSTVEKPTVSALYNKKGKQVLMLEENKRLQKTMAEYNLGKTEFFKLKTSENVQLNGWMIKPPNFDPNKKYPVLMHVYGGPGSQTVKNQYLGFNFFWHQMLAEQGYIIVSVDNRGTGGRGEAFKKVTYGELGKYEAIDQIEAAKWLAKQSYVDGSRIGIWGWSFGGYMTSLCLTKGGGVFKAGIAVAPVTNWRFYDTIYTERYLKTPKLNPSGYDDNSPIQFASALKGNYLLVHGMADDNVHFQNSVEWTDALISLDIPFDMAFYPNKNHGIFGGLTRLHLYRKMTNFVLENL